MRIRRTIIAPIALTIGTVGSLALGPAVTILSAAAPAAAPVAAMAATPNYGYHM